MRLFILCSEFYKPINFVSEFCKICQNPTSAMNAKNRFPENLLETNINGFVIIIYRHMMFVIYLYWHLMSNVDSFKPPRDWGVSV